MAVPNIHNLTLIPLGLLVISRIYRAEGNGVCGDSNNQTTINKKSTVGSSVELSCNVTNITSSGWTVVNKENTVKNITIGETTFSEHYSLLSNESNVTPSTDSYFMYNLLISNSTEDQEGLYTCHDQGYNKAKVVLFVEYQKPKIIKETNFWSFTWGSSFANWSIWILLFAFGVIIITAIIARAVARYRKILPLSAPTSPYSLDGNESDRRLPSPIHRKTPTMSRHQFVDTSDRKYEIYVPQKGMAGNDFSLGRTANSTKERTVNMEEVDYLHILE